MSPVLSRSRHWHNSAGGREFYGRKWPDSRLGDPLGLLAGLAGFSAAAEPWEKETPSRQAMVFCGMEEKEVRNLLGKMNAAQLQVELKAVMTAHNQRWPFGALLEELEKEHLALHQK